MLQVDSVLVFVRKCPRKIIRPLKTFKQELQSERQIRVRHLILYLKYIIYIYIYIYPNPNTYYMLPNFPAIEFQVKMKLTKQINNSHTIDPREHPIPIQA